MNNKAFAIPVVWSMGGYITINACNKEEALKYIKESIEDHTFELPIDCGSEVSYIEDSFQLSDDNDKVMLNIIKEV